jgi:hypothetical protein
MVTLLTVVSSASHADPASWTGQRVSCSVSSSRAAEPLKNRFTRRERWRQELVELCRRLVEAGARLEQLGIGMNQVSRSHQRGRPVVPEQWLESTRSFNAAMGEVNVAGQLITMSGHQELIWPRGPS